MTRWARAGRQLDALCRRLHADRLRWLQEVTPEWRGGWTDGTVLLRGREDTVRNRAGDVVITSKHPDELHTARDYGRFMMSMPRPLTKAQVGKMRPARLRHPRMRRRK